MHRDSTSRTRHWLFRASVIGVALALICALTMFVVVPRVPGLRKWAIRNGLRNDLGYTIEYVVPNGFRGIFVIEDAPEDGVAPQHVDSQTFRYTIPPSGYLSSSDVTPILTWHVSRGLYFDGRRINAGKVQLRELTGFDSQSKMYILIGTPADANRFWETSDVWSQINEDSIPLEAESK